MFTAGGADKPSGMNQPRRARLKRIFNAKKADSRHLDPLANGILPIAFGEADKTVLSFKTAKRPIVLRCAGVLKRIPTMPMAEIAAQSDCGRRRRYSRAVAGVHRTILQLPFLFRDQESMASAPMISRVMARRRYNSASVTIHALDLLSAEPDEAVFEARCGKEPMSARSPAISAEALAATAMSAPCGDRVGPSTKRMRCFSGFGRRRRRTRAFVPHRGRAMEVPRVVVDSGAAARLGSASRCWLRGQDAPFDGPPMPPVAASSSPLAQSRMGS